MAEVTVVRAEREEESTLEQGLLAIPEVSLNPPSVSLARRR
jgi:hypothetical protein